MVLEKLNSVINVRNYWKCGLIKQRTESGKTKTIRKINKTNKVSIFSIPAVSTRDHKLREIYNVHKAYKVCSMINVKVIKNTLVTIIHSSIQSIRFQVFKPFQVCCQQTYFFAFPRTACCESHTPICMELYRLFHLLAGLAIYFAYIFYTNSICLIVHFKRYRL